MAIRENRDGHLYQVHGNILLTSYRSFLSPGVLARYPRIPFIGLNKLTPWRNGSASDSRSEGCVFKSRRGQPILRTAYIPLSVCYYLLEEITQKFKKITVQLCYQNTESRIRK